MARKGKSEQPQLEEDEGEYGGRPLRDFIAYEGDEWLAEGWMLIGFSREEARARVADHRYVMLTLEFGGLWIILKDRWATRTLCDALLYGNEEMFWSLYNYASKRRPAKKPGPKPRSETGKFKGELIAELRAKGKTLGQIALLVYHDAKEAPLVAANLAQWKKKQARKKPAG